ncbi:MAG: hypothetical protein M3O67_00030 [Bacteroidota bacterium]|nr:hypothetical protein [Bacteroidota bacterium]
MKKMIILLFVVAILTSCVRSLYPITENEKETVFKKELLGHWKDENGTKYIIDTLNNSGGKIYRAEIIDYFKYPDKQFSDTSYFLVTLVNIRGKLFMDCMPEMEDLAVKKMGESAAYSLLPTHSIIRVFSIEQNSIELGSLDKDNFLMLLKQKKINIRHESITKDDILLTEKPKMLQQKLIELEKFPSVYKNKNRLTRIR